MGKTKRIQTKIADLLSGGPMSTMEIRDHINRTTCYGTSMSQLVNVLGKGGQFESVGTTKIGQVHFYHQKIWALKPVEASA